MTLKIEARYLISCRNEVPAVMHQKCEFTNHRISESIDIVLTANLGNQRCGHEINLKVTSIQKDGRP